MWRGQRSTSYDLEIARAEVGALRGAAIVEVIGEIDAANAVAFEQCLGAAMSAPRGVIIDLRRISFMDSSGVRAIAVVHDWANRSGRGVCLVIDPCSNVGRLLGITGVLDVVTVARDLEVALAQLSCSPN